MLEKTHSKVIRRVRNLTINDQFLDKTPRLGYFCHFTFPPNLALPSTSDNINDSYMDNIGYASRRGILQQKTHHFWSDMLKGRFCYFRFRWKSNILRIYYQQCNCVLIPLVLTERFPFFGNWPMLGRIYHDVCIWIGYLMLKTHCFHFLFFISFLPTPFTFLHQNQQNSVNFSNPIQSPFHFVILFLISSSKL